MLLDGRCVGHLFWRKFYLFGSRGESYFDVDSYDAFCERSIAHSIGERTNVAFQS